MNRSQIKTKKKKISPVDIVIAIIFLIALLSMIYLTFTLLDEDNSGINEGGIAADCKLSVEQVDIERFGITLNEVTGGIECAFLNVGDQVYDPESGESIGRVNAITYEIATMPTGEVDEEGNLIYAEYPGYIDLIVTVRTELASETDRTVGSLNLQLGRELKLRTASYEADALVVGMETGVN